jgi:hypothetical protein
MNVSSVTSPAALGETKGLQTLAASQLEAQKEASAGVINDGDEPLVGSNVNKLA